MTPDSPRTGSVRTDARGSESPRKQPRSRLRVWSGFARAYALANLQSALEYRVSFATQVFAMMLNDGMWLVFWLAYFDKFQVVEGWGRADIVTLWAVVAASFGLATTVCGNLFRLAGLIVRGELDIYLALPKPVLPHMLMSRMSVTAPGDVLFGVIGFGLLVHPTPGQWILFLSSILTGSIIFVAFGVVSQSLSFWLGNAEGVAEQLTNALINFSTYPTPIFRGVVKLALFTLLPAGFIAYLPVQLFREFTWLRLAALWGVAALALTLAVMVFRAGLRRYESGNLVLTRQ
ncbi:MAG: ABC-2 family transporter protein [Candidatus Eisenbacteria bacterium]|uniref:ABC-2 family transporter protein n=1 Tax=Eiseniibacteriota bacterium TaxID=2212470 RepID=A0A956M153_UNCEI|nr:ABC-2 family transporter protein [Candidatus Eisenbacteria bacterium]